MRLINFFKTKKLLLLNIVLSIYIVTNLIGGERGLVSYYEKKKLDEELVLKKESFYHHKIITKTNISIQE